MNVVIEVARDRRSGLMFLYVRYAPHAPQTKTDAGLLYIVVNAVGVALLNSWRTRRHRPTSGTLSWNTVVILVGVDDHAGHAAEDARRRRSWRRRWIRSASGSRTCAACRCRPSSTRSCCSCRTTRARSWPSLPSHVLQRLGRRLRQAQEMGSYHLVELLGRGGMGEVWRGTHRLLARSAAIKLVRPELLGASREADARSMLRRFEREAQATAALSSPHTIRVFDFGVTEDGTFYYVMELLAGRDLESLVREFGPVPADRAPCSCCARCVIRLPTRTRGASCTAT